ncbi:MAG: hypothetical protein Kow0068_18820 [Marinilabiliales bacterium]
MYLVLTALLALNVSAEIINAFVLFDDTLVKTRENFESKNDQVLTNFQSAYEENKIKVGPWKDKAEKVAKKADELIELMNGYKEEIITAGGGMNEEDVELIKQQRNIAGDVHGFFPAGAIAKKDDLNAGGQIMVGADEKGKGLELKAKIEEFREFLKTEIIEPKDESVKKALDDVLNTEPMKTLEGTEHEWHLAYFDHMPLVACITSLSKLQSDVRNAEADILNYLYKKIDAGSLKFNKLNGEVFPVSSYVMSGDEYQARIFLAAFDTTKNPDIFIGKFDSVKVKDPAVIDYKEVMLGEEGKDYFKLDSVVDGVGYYKAVEGVGYHEVQGVIFFETDDKRVLKYPFYSEYQVAQGSVVISPTKMNVFYIGVDNPVEISVPGVSQDKIYPSISGGGGSIIKSGKGYIVRVSTPTQNCMISVSAEINGKRRSMGSMNFRVKRVPDPVATCAGSKGGTIKKSLLLSQAGVKAELENFDFDLNFTVVGFTVSASIGGFTQEAQCSGPRFNEKAYALMRKVDRGGKVYIEDVKAKGPDGSVRKLGSIIFKLN